MPDPRLLPLLDLIAANIAAAVIAERASGDVLAADVDCDSSEPPDAHESRSGGRVAEAAP